VWAELNGWNEWILNFNWILNYVWTGENVSTTEVEGVVARGAGMKGVVVYGVQLVGTEGRCGMAAIADPEENLDVEQLTYEINKQLPKYARPLFLRIIKEIEMTGMCIRGYLIHKPRGLVYYSNDGMSLYLLYKGTFKLKKLGLQEEGYDPQKIADRLFFYDGDRYVPLDKELHEKVTSGVIRIWNNKETIYCY